MITTDSACKVLNFLRSPSSDAVFIAGINIWRAGSVVKKIANKATEATGDAVKTVAPARNELPKTKI